MELEVSDISGLEAAVVELLSFAGKRRKFTFTGEVGAGKTTFIQAFCRHLGVKEHVTSPTYALVNEYTFQDQDGVHLVNHLDLYRLKNLEEALEIGIEEYLDDDTYCLIEWPELIEELLPPGTVRVIISIEEHSKRKIIFL